MQTIGRQVRIALSHLNAAMPKKRLNLIKRYALVDQKACICMPQIMNTNIV